MNDSLQHFFKITLAILSWLFCHPMHTTAQVHLNEILAVNATISHDPDFGEFSDFVELYHSGTASVHLEGHFLTDDPTNKTKWALPPVILQPGQFLVIWTDGRDKYPGDTAFVAYKNAVATMTGLHASFRLSSAGEYLALYNPEGDLLDDVTYCTQSNDIAYGRNPEMFQQWTYSSEPTPGTPNSTFCAPDMTMAGAPVFSLNEGMYAGAQTLTLSTVEPGAVIRFTFDGSTPTADSPVFPGSFTMTRSYTVKARLYAPGKMPGKVVTKSYLINEGAQLPVMAISTNASNFFGFDFGILQHAIKDREVPATIEYFEPSGERAFLAGVGVRVFGTSIYALPQRPLSIRFKEKFGDELLKFPLFGGKPVQSYTSFLLRNGGNDYNMAFFRDGLAVNLIKGKMDLDYQDYKPCVVFINGEYHGIYEIRERLDEVYIGTNHEINSANLDYLEDNQEVLSGDAVGFADLMAFVVANDLSDPDHFARVAEAIDLEAYSNYLIQRIFIGYQIGDLNNRYWRNKDTNGKWRWIAADMEHGFGQLGGDHVSENTLEKLAGLSGNLPDWSTVLFRRLLQNISFRDAFIQRSAAYLNTIYQPETTLATVDSLKNLLATQMPRHIGRWNTPTSVQSWTANVNFIKSYLQQRPAYFRTHLSATFAKQDSAQVSIHFVGEGKVKVSGVAFSSDMQGPFFKNTQLALEAIPAPGYQFIGWQGLGSNTSTYSFLLAGDTTFTAVFAPYNISIIPPVIDHDTVLSAALSPWYGLEQIEVLPNVRLTVEAGAQLHLSDGVGIHVRGGLHFSGQATNRITVQPDPLPSARRGFYGQKGFWGAITAKAATDSIIVQYTDLRGGSFGQDRGQYFATISALNTVIHMDHSTITGGKMPLVARGGRVTLTHSQFHTFNSCNGFISLYDMDAPLVEYCIFEGNRAINTDGIDLKGITNGRVRYNQVSGFLGDNCDGIDLGIYSLNNLIEYNIIHDCTDKGISIGSQSNAMIRRNLIFDCDLGVAVKDSFAVAHIDQNTFFGNRHAVACYEKSALRGGGTAFVKNSILAASSDSDVLQDVKSSINISYSLSDQTLLPGTGNLLGDPLFSQPSSGNFELEQASPCINTGDPFSPLDPDGTRADMGAYYQHVDTTDHPVRINEFSYHPPNNYPTGDWVELYNASNQPINVQHWSLRHGTLEWKIPHAAVVAPGNYLVLCQQAQSFDGFHPGTTRVPVDFKFDLNNKAGKIALYDATGKLVYNVRYTDAAPWPTLADGHGATVELAENQPGNVPSEWHESYVLLGTPGANNSLPRSMNGLFVNEIMASNTATLPDETGSFDDWFELYNSSADTLDIGGLCVTDDDDVPCKYQIPLNFPEKTRLLPQGFLVLWADGASEEGALHTNFKLSASGEQVAVYQRKNGQSMLLDEVLFGAQQADISWGRYPDGGVLLATMPPSPGASNITTGSQEPSTPTIPVFPNPFSDQLLLDASQVQKPYQLTLLDALGRQVVVRQSIYDETLVLSREQWASGWYVLSLRDAAGRQFVTKVLAE